MKVYKKEHRPTTHYMPIGAAYVSKGEYFTLSLGEEGLSLHTKKGWYDYHFELSKDKEVWTFAPRGQSVSFRIQEPVGSPLKVLFTDGRICAIYGNLKGVARQGLGWACWELMRANNQKRFPPVYSLSMVQGPEVVSRSIRGQDKIHEFLEYKHIPKSLRHRVTLVAIDNIGQMWVVRNGLWELFLNRESEDHRLIV